MAKAAAATADGSVIFMGVISLIIAVLELFICGKVFDGLGLGTLESTLGEVTGQMGKVRQGGLIDCVNSFIGVNGNPFISLPRYGPPAITKLV
jgi:hypothetical protein